MKNFGERFKKYYITYIVTAAICLAIGAGIFCLMFFLRNKTIKDGSDGCMVAGAVIALSGCLVLLNRFGAYDTFAYGFKQVGASFFNRNKPNKYNDLVDYKHQANIKRQSSPDYWFPMVVVGALFLIGAIVLSIVYNFQIA